MRHPLFGWSAAVGALVVIVPVAHQALAAGPPPLQPVPVLEVFGSTPSSILPRVALSPCGKYVAFCCQHNADDVEVRALPGGKRLFRRDIRFFRYASGMGLIQFAPDSRSLVVCSTSRGTGVTCRTTVRQFEVPLGRLLVKHGLPEGIGQYGILLQDGKTLALSSLDEAAVLYDLKSGKRLASLKGPERMPGVPVGPASPSEKPRPFDKAKYENETTHMAASPDGRWLAVGTNGGWASVWDLNTQTRQWRKRLDEGLLQIAFSRDSKALLVVDGSRRMAFWRAKEGTRKGANFVGRYGSFAHPLPGGDLLMSRWNRPGFLRWDPAKDQYKGGPWGEFFSFYTNPKSSIPSSNDIRSRVNSHNAVAVSANGKMAAIVTAFDATWKPKGERAMVRLTVYDLSRMKWQVRDPWPGPVGRHPNWAAPRPRKK